MGGSDEKNKALNRMRGLCSRREYAKGDIKKKLERYKSLTNEEIFDILSSLEEDNYINNARFALAFARDKSGIDGWGEVKISYALSLKGVFTDDIKNALAQLDKPKAETKLEKLVLNKKKLLVGDPNIRMKLIKYLISRGYPYEKSKEITDKCLRGNS